MASEPYESEEDRKRRAAEEAQPLGTNPILDAIRANRQNFALSPGIERLMAGSAAAAAQPGKHDPFGNVIGPGGFSTLRRRHEVLGELGVDPMGGP